MAGSQLASVDICLQLLALHMPKDHPGQVMHNYAQKMCRIALSVRHKDRVLFRLIKQCQCSGINTVWDSSVDIAMWAGAI